MWTTMNIIWQYEVGLFMNNQRGEPILVWRSCSSMNYTAVLLIYIIHGQSPPPLSWCTRSGGQLKTCATTIKADLEPISIPRVFGHARWRKDWVKVSCELAQDLECFCPKRGQHDWWCRINPPRVNTDASTSKPPPSTYSSYLNVPYAAKTPHNTQDTRPLRPHQQFQKWKEVYLKDLGALETCNMSYGINQFFWGMQKNEDDDWG